MNAFVHDLRDGLRQMAKSRGVYGYGPVRAGRRHRGKVVAMMMREAGGLLAIGVVIGTPLALVAGRSPSSLLFGLKPQDPLPWTSRLRC